MNKLKRIIGGHKETIDGIGVTVLDEPFTASDLMYQSLVIQTERFAQVDDEEEE